MVCHECAHLVKSNDALGNILHRIKVGVHPNAKHHFRSIGDFIELERRKKRTVASIRLEAFNLRKKLDQRARSLSDHKKFVMAVASGDVKRVDALVRTATRAGASIHRLVALMDAAANDLYRPRGHDEEEMMKAIVFLRFGGARTSEFAHRTLGLPGLSTVRRWASTTPLRTSPSRPTMEEVQHNINVSFPAPSGDALPPSGKIPYVLMLDEVKINSAPRWCPTTNNILGVCREHSSDLTLQFETMQEANLLCDALAAGTTHLATEATVAALGALSKGSRDNSARPILISPTCKRESGDEHASLIQTVHDACIANESRIHGSVMCVASDGESRRGRALDNLYLKRPLSRSAPAFTHLERLKLLNLLVGDGDVTLDKDYKHVMKRLRNLLLRNEGLVIDGVKITSDLIRFHLISSGVSSHSVDSWLNPNDKQDVPLMYSLLRALWSLPDAQPTDKPAWAKSRTAIHMFGRLCFYLVAPYIQVSLSLSDQLEYLSAAAHLAVALFTRDNARSHFMPASLFLDIMHMVKNAYFCVAKLKADDPDGDFWLILLGTDRLEAAFGMLRTMVGNDTNADSLQLGTRLSHVAQVANIFSRKPEWDRSPRRIRIGAMDESGQMSRDVDHITPTTWRGDVSLRHVVPHTCWKMGRLRVEREFAAHGIASQLLSVEQTPGADILSPFGQELDPLEGDEEFDDD
ncbi:hypothetical protein AURDEDRAFT_62190, partial [Auricularia subglabra TFB-10046 SS5]